MKPLIILLLAILAQSVSGQILFSNRVTGETGYVTNVDEYFQDARVVATNVNNKFGGDGSLLTGLPASGPPLNGTNAWSGTNSFAKPVTVDNLTSTNGVTNLSLTASTVLLSDANKKTVSLANGGANTLLHGTAPPAYSSIANSDLANSSITVSGGGGVGISGSPVSLGGTVTVGTTTDQRQMSSLGLGVAASATPGTFQGTNTLYVGTGTIGSSNRAQIDWTNGMALGVNNTNGNVTINGKALLRTSDTLNFGAATSANVEVGRSSGNQLFVLLGDGSDYAYFLCKQFQSQVGGAIPSGASYAFTTGSGIPGSNPSVDTGTGRNAAGVVEANNGTQGALRDFVARNITATTTIIASNGLSAVSGAATAQFITNVVYTNVSLDFPSTAAGTSSDMLVTIANLKSNDLCTVNPSATVMQANSYYWGWVSNTSCYVRFINSQLVTAIDPASGTFQVKVEQWK